VKTKLFLISGCGLFALLAVSKAQAERSPFEDLEALRESTKRVVIGDYCRSRSRDSTKDVTVNVWTNIVDRKEIEKLIILLSKKDELRDVGAGFSSPLASQIYLGTNDVPLLVIDLYCSQASRFYSLNGTFQDGRLSGTYSSDIEEFMNHKYIQEVLGIARKTHDGLFPILVAEERLNKQFHEQITLEQRFSDMSGAGKSGRTGRDVRTNAMDRSEVEK
jgi:hypothetical protein